MSNERREEDLFKLEGGPLLSIKTKKVKKNRKKKD
jgi:hypothetical protein